MKKQYLIIISIIVIGSLSSVGYAASTIITDTSISTTNLTVTGTCTGCGGESSFTTYSLLLNTTIPTSTGGIVTQAFVGNDGSVLINDVNSKTTLVKVDGSVVLLNAVTDQHFVPNTGFSIGQSETGKYKFVILNGNETINVYKDNIKLQNIVIATSSGNFCCANDQGVGISANAKYIAVYGPDFTLGDRIQIWQGS